MHETRIFPSFRECSTFSTLKYLRTCSSPTVNCVFSTIIVSFLCVNVTVAAGALWYIQHLKLSLRELAVCNLSYHLNALSISECTLLCESQKAHLITSVSVEYVKCNHVVDGDLLIAYSGTENIHVLYIQFKENEMGTTCSTHGWGDKRMPVLVGKSEEKRPLGRHRRRWENKNKMGLQEIG
jgi:hypothetical protein